MQAAIVIPLTVIALGLFLKVSAAGVAIRASADSADRASLLGVPVKRLQTVVWMVAALLAFIAIYLRAGLVGLPVTSALSFGVLLRALAALLIGRLTNLVTIFTTALALGVLELGIFRNAESPLLIDPILGAVIAVALLLRRRSSGTHRHRRRVELALDRRGPAGPSRAGPAPAGAPRPLSACPRSSSPSPSSCRTCSTSSGRSRRRRC